MPASVTAIWPGVPAAAAVRAQPCHFCHAGPGGQCTPSGDHLARWLGAHSAGRITRAELTAVIVRLVVLTEHAVISPDGAA